MCDRTGALPLKARIVVFRDIDAMTVGADQIAFL
jgi:hypothetical protein